MYFLALFIGGDPPKKRLLSVTIALTAVELFEIFDGFGIMSNVYDANDLLANLAGVGLAYVLDSILTIPYRKNANST